MNEYLKQLRPMLDKEELLKTLEVRPQINRDLVNRSEKLSALLEIYKTFIPNQEAVDIYYQLYLMLMSSLEKKDSLDQIRRLNENYKVIKGNKRYGILGGLESYRITGQAGTGKSSTIQRCAEIITASKVIRLEKPHREVIPILIVECVADGSFKSLLYSILQSVDEILETSYFIANKHDTTTVDSLLSVVSSVLINHVALLVIDECERVANSSKRGELLINYLTQLVNQSNIPICFVGNESCNAYFENKEYLARRTTGLSIKKMSYDERFYNFVKQLFLYQIVENKIEVNSELMRLLYTLSDGLPSMLVALFVEAQKEAIISGDEKITEESLKRTFSERFTNMIPHLQHRKVAALPRVKEMVKTWPNISKVNDRLIFKELSMIAKKDLEVFTQLLQKVIAVELVEI